MNLDQHQKVVRLDLADHVVGADEMVPTGAGGGVVRDAKDCVCWDNPVDPRAGVAVCRLCETPAHPTLVRQDGCFRCNPLAFRRPKGRRPDDNNPAAAGSSSPLTFALSLLAVALAALTLSLSGYVLMRLFG